MPFPWISFRYDFPGYTDVYFSGWLDDFRMSSGPAKAVAWHQLQHRSLVEAPPRLGIGTFGCTCASHDADIVSVSEPPSVFL